MSQFKGRFSNKKSHCFNIVICQPLNLFTTMKEATLQANNFIAMAYEILLWLSFSLGASYEMVVTEYCMWKKIFSCGYVYVTVDQVNALVFSFFKDLFDVISGRSTLSCSKRSKQALFIFNWPKWQTDLQLFGQLGKEVLQR